MRLLSILSNHGPFITWLNDSLCACVYENFTSDIKNQAHSELVYVLEYVFVRVINK